MHGERADLAIYRVEGHELRHSLSMERVLEYLEPRSNAVEDVAERGVARTRGDTRGEFLERRRQDDGLDLGCHGTSGSERPVRRGTRWATRAERRESLANGLDTLADGSCLGQPRQNRGHACVESIEVGRVPRERSSMVGLGYQ